MSKPDWQGRFTYLFWYVAFVFAGPIAAIWTAFHNNWTTTGLWLAGIYAVLLLIEFGTMAFNLVRRCAAAWKKDPLSGVIGA